MNKLPRQSVPLLMLALVALAPRLASAQEWKEFSSPECRCSAQFPGAPQPRTQPLQSKYGSHEAKMWILDVPGNAFFALFYMDYPKDSFAKAKPEDLLADARDEAVKNVKGKLVSETKITMNGYPGREFKIASPGALNLHARIFLAKERLYQVIAVVPEARDSAGDAKKFLDSFKFQKP
jgi:hypothetical protein